MNTSKEFDNLIKEIQNCNLCPLSENRSRVVISSESTAKIMFIGEAPGEQEDIEGKPFVGRSGKLLRSMVQTANIDIEKEVYITNICKCRPPKNRKPTNNEIISCNKYLLKEIEILKPKVIICFGSTAASSLLFLNEKKALTITNLKGQVFDLNGIKVIPTFHPSYLLRNRSLIDSVIDDLKKIYTFL